jgi:hypothetical protein
VFADQYADDTLAYIHTTVNYHKPGVPIPVFTTYVRQGVISIGFDTLGAFTYAINDASVGLHHLGTPQSLARVFPNPATDQVAVQLIDAAESAVAITLMDATGRVVGEPALVSASSARSVHLRVDDLRPGIYFLKINDTGGRTGSVPLVVE